MTRVSAGGPLGGGLESWSGRPHRDMPVCVSGYVSVSAPLPAKSRDEHLSFSILGRQAVGMRLCGVLNELGDGLCLHSDVKGRVGNVAGIKSSFL